MQREVRGSGHAHPHGERRRLADDYETRADLYAEARRLGIEGRSKMTKAELRDAVERAAAR